ncbi:MAG: GYF domain-containing protein [Planctomycetota bacterium]|nr:GYF domain-containing protein [Planctomycetota bacterium]
MTQQWHYSAGSQRVGPVSDPVMRQMIGAGQLPHDTLVWTEGMANWVPASSVESWRDAFASAPTVVAPPTAPGPLGVEAARRVDPGIAMLVPVGRSAYAIIAGYLGLFSVLLLPAPFALLSGILALRDIKKHPEKRGKGRAIFGIVMGVLGTGLLAFVVISSMAR